MTQDPLVVIVILNWNGLEQTLACINSISRSTYRNRAIVVIDNGSEAGQWEPLAALDGITFIRNAANLGYTGGCNLGMRRALELGADYVWLLNNDAVAEPEALARLIAVAEADPRIGLLSPVVRDDADRSVIHFAGGHFDLAVPLYEPTDDLAKGRQWQARFADRMALWGTAMLARRALIETIGMLDDRIFAYWEDIDYSIRGAVAGFRNVMVFDAAIFHAAKPTMRSPLQVKPYYFYFMARNEILMWRKFCRGPRLAKSLLWALRRQGRQIDLMRESPEHVDAVLAGVWDGLFGVGGGYRQAGSVKKRLARAAVGLSRLA